MAGSRHFRNGDYEQALEAFEQSQRLHDSPNSTLLIGRTLARLGRYVEAYERLGEAEQQAGARVAAGEERYEQTATAAAEERAVVRRKLSEVAVKAPGAPGGTEVEIDGERHPLSADGEASFVRAPGGVTIVVHLPTQPPITRSLELTAGRDVELDLDLASASLDPDPQPPSPPDEDGSGSVWILPAVVAGGVTLVGAGLFAGFGAKAASVRSDLEERCSPSCGATDEEDRTEGEQSAAVANAGLVVGLAGLAATMTFTILALTDDDDEPPAEPPLALTIGPGQLGLLGRF